jgi:CheY-specific phosphatase CheX
MTPPSDEILAKVAAQTLENLAFILVVTEDQAAPAAGPAVRAAASVRFEGPLSGQLVVTVDQAVLPPLASNMLGLDASAEATVVEQSDALKELANVICGNLLPEIAGHEAVFTVRPPILIDAESAASASDPPTSTARLTLDAGTAHLALYVFGQAAVALAGRLEAHD